EQSIAMRALKQAVTLNPDLVPERMLLTRLLIKDNLDEAAQQITVLSDNIGETAQVAELRGLLAMEQGEYAEARAHYLDAFERQANNQNLMRLVSAETELGLYAEAASRLRKWLKEYPDDAATWFELANRELQRGEETRALEAFKRVQTLNPDNPLVLNNLAWLGRRENPTEALAHARKAVKLAPDSADFQDTLAMVALAADSPREALSAIRRALDSRPDDVTFQYHNAVILAENGDKAKALLQLEKLLQGGKAFPDRDKAIQLRDGLSKQ
ncbi:MAG: tetratricopeptide repeat protein, partial [Chromatocurvus sp.]